MKIDALSTTAQALAITSNLLAIGIELGIVAGGIYIYKKLTESQKEGPHDAVLVPEGYELIEAPQKEATFRERWEKLGKIFRAVVG